MLNDAVDPALELHARIKVLEREELKASLAGDNARANALDAELSAHDLAFDSAMPVTPKGAAVKLAKFADILTGGLCFTSEGPLSFADRVPALKRLVRLAGRGKYSTADVVPLRELSWHLDSLQCYYPTGRQVREIADAMCRPRLVG